MNQDTQIVLQRVEREFAVARSYFPSGPLSAPLDPALRSQVNEALSWVKVKAKDLETRLKAFTKPHRDAEKVVRDWFRPFQAQAEDLEKRLKGLLVEDQKAQDRARGEALALVQKAVQESRPQDAVQALAAVPEQEKLKGTSFKKILRFEIIDPSAVPRELCSPDPKKIEAALALTREIPGVRVYEDLQVAHRTS